MGSVGQEQQMRMILLPGSGNCLWYELTNLPSSLIIPRFSMGANALKSLPYP